jgi:alcohol dehydrogenase
MEDEMETFEQARELIKQFKGQRYSFGLGVLPEVGTKTSELGKSAVLILDKFPKSEACINAIKASLTGAGVRLLGEINGAAPNAPREDVMRITEALLELNPEVVVSFGGGSTIDAAKAAIVLASLGGSIDDYFGTGLVTHALAEKGLQLTPHVAIQTAASSAAHLTKYSNITDLEDRAEKADRRHGYRTNTLGF